MRTKVCTWCNKRVSIFEFARVRAGSLKRRSHCNDCKRAYTRNYLKCSRPRANAWRKQYQAKIRALVTEAKNKPCTDCGVWYPHYVMDLDHLRDKKFTMARVHLTNSVRLAMRELAKCEVVCANCHRERTHNRR